MTERLLRTRDVAGLLETEEATRCLQRVLDSQLRRELTNRAAVGNELYDYPSATGSCRHLPLARSRLPSWRRNVRPDCWQDGR